MSISNSMNPTRNGISQKRTKFSRVRPANRSNRGTSCRRLRRAFLRGCFISLFSFLLVSQYIQGPVVPLLRCTLQTLNFILCPPSLIIHYRPRSLPYRPTSTSTPSVCFVVLQRLSHDSFE